MSTLYMIIDTTTKEMYAWTENKEIAKLFITMRKPGRFIIKKKKIKANDEYEAWKYRLFMSDYRGDCLMQNVLGRTKKDTLTIPTTYSENYSLEKACDNLYDTFLQMSRDICMLPLEDSFREIIEMLTYIVSREGGKYVRFDTFRIFVELFKDTML